VTRASGPEEFFEAFRGMQQAKKRPEGEAPDEAPVQGAPRAESQVLATGEVTLSYPAVAGGVVIVLLLVVLGYLVGRQHGWRAYEGAIKRQAEEAAQKPQSATPAAKASGAVSSEPEVIDGMVFTMLTLGKTPADRASVEKEAEYLNRYAPFTALQVEAYVWRDKAGRYRLCARGLQAMDAATRAQVRDQIRNLVSRQGRREYRDSDLLPQ